MNACVCLVLPDDAIRLKAVLYSAQNNIHSSSQLFKLAQETFKLATVDGVKHKPLMNTALKLGLQVALEGYMCMYEDTLVPPLCLLHANRHSLAISTKTRQ